jgi:hypothetical protein
MGTTKKNNSSNSMGATGEQSPHAIFPKPLPAVLHGLYIDLVGFQIDRRTRIAQTIKKLTFSLLERFSSPAPAAAQLLAQRTAFKLIRAASFEVFVLNGGKASERVESDYISLTESIRKDIQSLWLMAKDAGPDKPKPDLQTYLYSLQEAGKLHSVEPVEGDKDPADPVMSTQRKKTLF